MDDASKPKRPRAGLSRAVIADAALSLVDERGVAVTSMRAIAGHLHVEAMSLYRYVGSRDDLFDAVVDRVVDELDADPGVREEPADDWAAYLTALAHGVRRYALRHPHAFPLVATRPTQAPWINPPLRSLRWIERLLTALEHAGFADEHILFTYRSFNSFLLGYLLLETGAMTLADPKPGDGALSAEPASTTSDDGPDGSPSDSTDVATAVPGALTPARSVRAREQIAATAGPDSVSDVPHPIDPVAFPVISRLADGLAEDRWEREFEVGLSQLLDRIAIAGGHGGYPSSSGVYTVSLAVAAALGPDRCPPTS